MAPQVLDEMCAWIIIWHDEQHLSVQEIAALVGCNAQTVYNILSYHCDYHTLRDPLTCGPHGTNHSLDMGDMNYIEFLIDVQPKIYLDENFWRGEMFLFLFQPSPAHFIGYQ